MTIAQQIKWDFKTNGNLKIYDKNGNKIYYEKSNGFWSKWEHDLKVIQSTLRVQMDFGKSGNTILKVIQSTTRIHMV